MWWGRSYGAELLRNTRIFPCVLCHEKTGKGQWDFSGGVVEVLDNYSYMVNMNGVSHLTKRPWRLHLRTYLGPCCIAGSEAAYTIKASMCLWNMEDPQKS